MWRALINKKKEIKTINNQKKEEFERREFNTIIFLSNVLYKFRMFVLKKLINDDFK